jgi:hypothetical protein
MTVGVSDRELWLYDTFEGMPPPQEADKDFMGVQAADHLTAAAGDRDDPVVAYASLDEVRANVQTIGYPAELVRYVVGQVEHTIPAQAPSEIALLRLDTDWESSTRHELEHLWPRLAVGGVLVIDDYGHWSGARQPRSSRAGTEGRQCGPSLAGRQSVNPCRARMPSIRERCAASHASSDCPASCVTLACASPSTRSL